MGPANAFNYGVNSKQKPRSDLRSINIRTKVQDIKLNFIQQSRSSITRRIIYTAILSLLSFVIVATQKTALAENRWAPEKTITIIAPSNPGGGWDQTARFLQHAITTEDLSPVGVEVVNRGGAGGTIGLGELVDRYKGDPYKLMVTGFGMNGAVVMHGSKHSLLGGTPLARLTGEYQAIAVPMNSPIHSIDDLVAALKRDPDAVSIGGGSAGGADQIFAALLAEEVGVDSSNLNYVAFTGGGEAAAALLGGQVTAGVSGYAEWGSLEEAGRIRLLAVSSAERVVDPNLPTFRELGYDVVFQNWRGVMAPPEISDEEAAWLSTLIARTRATETWRDVLEKNDWQDSYLAGDDFEAFISEDSDIIRGVLTRIGLGAAGQGYAEIGPYFFPKVIGFGLAICAAFLGFAAYKDRSRFEPAPVGDNVVAGEETNVKRFGVAVAALAVYIVSLRFVGFLIATPIFIVALSRLIGSRSLIRDAIVGVVLVIAVVLIFENLLNVDIP